MSIPQNFIQDLITRADIVEIIGARIPLRKKGSNFVAPCPFHNEKTPSFTVTPSKQFYYCFGCGAHGNAIGFLMQYERLNFVDAVETLATHLGLDVPKTENQQSTIQFTEMHEVLEKASQLYQKALYQSPKTIEYLKNRGLTSVICKNFNIGYSPNNGNHFQAIIAKNPNFRTHLITTGMLIQKDQRNADIFPRFRDRLMFPIRNRKGQIIGFGGRTMGSNNPKYLNSPETPLFHKGGELYGLFEARKVNKDMTSIIVVEGYMDVIALAQFGISNVVATLGTAITAKQVQQLLNSGASEIIFCFDGDLAGKKAAWRALENSLPLMREGVQTKFLFLPKNEDPDSLVRKEGAQGFIARLSKTILFSDFFFQEISSKTNINTIDGRAKLAKEANALIQKMPNGIFKQLMLSKLSSLVHLDIDNVNIPSVSEKPHFNSANSNHNNIINATLSPPQVAVSLLLHYPELIKLTERLEQINPVEPTVKFLVKFINMLKKINSEQQNLNIGAILEYCREDTDLGQLAKLAAWQPTISTSNLKNEFQSIIERICEQDKEYTIKNLLQKANKESLTNEEKVLLQNLIKQLKIKT